MVSKKIRRNSGRMFGKIEQPTMKFDKIKEEALEPDMYYDDWQDHRDGFRDYESKKRKEKEKKKFPYKKGGKRRCK